MVKRIVFLVLGLVVVSLVMLGLNGNITGKASYSIRTCTDSDGGKNPSQRGTVEAKGLSSVKLLTFTDTCRTARSLAENYCEYKEHMKVTIPCPHGCQDGACLPPKK